jgi:hypothetical protein
MTKKNMEALRGSSKEVGLEGNGENYVHVSSPECWTKSQHKEAHSFKFECVTMAVANQN